jgi:hypothetical protein
MGSSWTPVGIGDGYKTVEEFDNVMEHLVSVPGSRTIVERMDARFAALPGLQRLRIYSEAMAGALTAAA